MGYISRAFLDDVASPTLLEMWERSRGTIGPSVGVAGYVAFRSIFFCGLFSFIVSIFAGSFPEVDSSPPLRATMILLVVLSLLALLIFGACTLASMFLLRSFIPDRKFVKDCRKLNELLEWFAKIGFLSRPELTEYSNIEITKRAIIILMIQDDIKKEEMGSLTMAEYEKKIQRMEEERDSLRTSFKSTHATMLKFGLVESVGHVLRRSPQATVEFNSKNQLILSEVFPDQPNRTTRAVFYFR